MVDGLGVWGPVVFVAGYALATVAFVPGSLLTLAAGAIFGLGKGTALVLVAATLGASAAFLVSRYLARGASSSAAWPGTRGSPRSTAPSGRQGRSIVLLLRLSPGLPVQPAQLRAGPHPRALRRLSGRVGRDAARHAALRVLRQGGGRRGPARRRRGGAGRGAGVLRRCSGWDWSPRWSVTTVVDPHGPPRASGGDRWRPWRRLTAGRASRHRTATSGRAVRPVQPGARRQRAPGRLGQPRAPGALSPGRDRRRHGGPRHRVDRRGSGRAGGAGRAAI